MALNKVVEQGRIPFDLKVFNEGDDKKAVVMGQISVRRNFKKADEEYYPEDLLDFKAFGAQANFINQYFGKGSNVILEGELRRNENYEKDGETVYGQMYIHVTGVHFQNGNAEGSNGGTEKKTSGKPAAKSGASKPAASKKATNPLAGKRQSIL